MPVREGYLCLRRGLEPPLHLGPLALRLRDLRLQRGPLRRHGVFGARTRALQLRRLKPSGHRGQRTDRVKDLLSDMSWHWSSGRGTGGGSVGHHFAVLHAELRDVILRHRQQLRVPIQLRLPTHSQQLSTIS